MVDGGAVDASQPIGRATAGSLAEQRRRHGRAPEVPPAVSPRRTRRETRFPMRFWCHHQPLLAAISSHRQRWRTARWRCCATTQSLLAAISSCRPRGGQPEARGAATSLSSQPSAVRRRSGLSTAKRVPPPVSPRSHQQPEVAGEDSEVGSAATSLSSQPSAAGRSRRLRSCAATSLSLQPSADGSGTSPSREHAATSLSLQPSGRRPPRLLFGCQEKPLASGAVPACSPQPPRRTAATGTRHFNRTIRRT